LHSWHSFADLEITYTAHFGDAPPLSDGQIGWIPAAGRQPLSQQPSPNIGTWEGDRFLKVETYFPYSRKWTSLSNVSGWQKVDERI